MKKDMNLLKKIFSSDARLTKNSSIEPSVEREFKKIINTLNKFKRVAYLPKTQINANTFSTLNKIGGFPYLRNENDWPICPNCKKNMQLFLQLNLEDIPKDKEKGLVQLFYCTTEEPHCESDLEAFFPFSEAVCCRKIQITDEPVKIQPTIDQIFEEKLIIEWIPTDDYPHFEEYEKLGIEWDISNEVLELMEERKVGLPIEKDKLFGWPYWVQAEEYPYDKETGNQMELLFQFVSKENLAYMFGDDGIGHLTQSPDNKTALGFGWACS